MKNQGKSLEEMLAEVSELELVWAGSGRGLESIGSVTFDSRDVGPGTLFVALSGARHDGHDFVQAAAEAGAVAVLVDRNRVEGNRVAGVDCGLLGCAVLAADNTRAVLGSVAAAFYGSPSRRLGVVGITGTNGKTTTSYLVEAVLAAAGRKCGVVGTINYRWGQKVLAAANTTPESLVLHDLMHQMEGERVTDVVMEVSSHGLSTHRLHGVLFDVGVFTNLTQDHLDFHGTMDAYASAKRRLFLEALPTAYAAGKKPVAVINLDDAEGRFLAEEVQKRSEIACLTYAVSQETADVYCTKLEQRIDGMAMQVRIPGGVLAIETGMLGEFNVSNCLAAVAAALARGVSSDAICKGLGGVHGVPGRLERVRLEDDDLTREMPAVFVDFAHTPDALERALMTLRPLVEGKLVVVFGCGGDRDRQKRGVMGRIAARLADRVWVTSDNPRSEDPGAIVAEILAGIDSDDMARVAHEVDRRRAIVQAILQAEASDVVLIAGKGHEKYQEIQGQKLVFDDVDEARKALLARR